MALSVLYHICHYPLKIYSVPDEAEEAAGQGKGQDILAEHNERRRVRRGTVHALLVGITEKICEDEEKLSFSRHMKQGTDGPSWKPCQAPYQLLRTSTTSTLLDRRSDCLLTGFRLLVGFLARLLSR